MKIDEKSSIPLGWAISGFITTITFAALGSFWISSVNDRLGRIEEKLGIPPMRSSVVLPIEKVYAGEKK